MLEHEIISSAAQRASASHDAFSKHLNYSQRARSPAKIHRERRTAWAHGSLSARRQRRPLPPWRYTRAGREHAPPGSGTREEKKQVATSRCMACLCGERSSTSSARCAVHKTQELANRKDNTHRTLCLQIVRAILGGHILLRTARVPRRGVATDIQLAIPAAPLHCRHFYRFPRREPRLRFALGGACGPT